MTPFIREDFSSLSKEKGGEKYRLLALVLTKLIDSIKKQRDEINEVLVSGNSLCVNLIMLSHFQVCRSSRVPAFFSVAVVGENGF
jgi:hypothetical protein